MFPLAMRGGPVRTLSGAIEAEATRRQENQGLGNVTLEVASRYDRDTCRTLYTVQFGAAVDVLHIFQKEINEGHAGH